MEKPQYKLSYWKIQCLGFQVRPFLEYLKIKYIAEDREDRDKWFKNDK